MVQCSLILTLGFTKKLKKNQKNLDILFSPKIVQIKISFCSISLVTEILPIPSLLGCFNKKVTQFKKLK